MTATTTAPETTHPSSPGPSPTPDAAARRRHLKEQLAHTAAHLQAELNAAITDMDRCLAELHAIEQRLAAGHLGGNPIGPA